MVSTWYPQTVHVDLGLVLVRTRKVMSCPKAADPSWSVDLEQLHGHTLSVVYLSL